jgi:hypothetical protein
MDNFDKELVHYVNATPDEQLNEAIRVLNSIPVVDRVKLILHIVQITPQVCETQLFVEFCRDPQVRALKL